MDKEEKLIINARSSDTKRRSKRVQKRKENGEGNVSKNVPKIVRKKHSKEEPVQVQPLIEPVQVQPLVEPSTIKKSEVAIGSSANGKKRRKRKPVSYEIDCSGINMNISDFQKDLWNRATNGKFNLAKNIRVKKNGNTIGIISRSYVSKKCIRSNVHFLTTMYLKKKKLDRSVHVVGNGNKYKLMYK